MKSFKDFYKAVADGVLPSATITATEKVVDNMFTIVKYVGNTATIRLNDGVEFDLKWHWELMQNENSSYFAEVWDKFPDEAKESIAKFVAENIPHGQFASFIPDPVHLHHFTSSATMHGLEFAGKVFELHGLPVSLLASVGVKLLCRAAVDQEKISLKKVGQDIATSVVSVGAVYGTKIILLTTIAHPPVAVVVAISALVGIGCGKLAQLIIKQKPSNL